MQEAYNLSHLIKSCGCAPVAYIMLSMEGFLGYLTFSFELSFSHFLFWPNDKLYINKHTLNK